MSTDGNDGKEWSQMDLADLEDALERGEGIEEAAIFLCRVAILIGVSFYWRR